MKLIPYILNWCAFILFICFVNGNIHFQSIPIPPLGKLINPFDGLWTSSTSHENQNAFITSSHINDEIVIYYDERRVPHIFAENLEDALFAQGYIEAQNRLFQMDFLARAAEGTLSEVLGPKTISIDLERRRRGMDFAAENTVQDWEKSPNYPYLQKYIDGVNAYISSLNIKDYPLEYKLLNCAPRTWDAYKTALITKNMALTLAGRDYDLEYSNLKNALGDSLFHLLYPERERNETPVVHDPDLSFDPIKVIQPSTEDASIKEPILHTFFDNRNKNAGSNSWAVSGQKSITGHPIFCNDPHLALSLPSIWFEVHIHTPLFNSYGVSIP